MPTQEKEFVFAFQEGWEENYINLKNVPELPGWRTYDYPMTNERFWISPNGIIFASQKYDTVNQEQYVFTNNNVCSRNSGNIYYEVATCNEVEDHKKIVTLIQNELLNSPRYMASLKFKATEKLPIKDTVLNATQLSMRIDREFQEFLENEKDASELKKSFFNDVHYFFTNGLIPLEDSQMNCLLNEKDILYNLYDFYIKYENESVENFNAIKELIENYNEQYHKETLTSFSMKDNISKNLGIKIDNYYEDLYSKTVLEKYYTPYELKRNTIEYLYDVNTDSFVFQTWSGNIACPCSATNAEIIGNTLLEICKRNALGENVEELEKTLQEEKKSFDSHYFMDFDSILPDKKEEYLNRLLIDFSADLDIWHEDIPGSCLYFKFNYLIDQFSTNTNISEEKRANAITALKECKQQSVYNMNLSNLSAEERKNLNYQDLTDKITAELKSFSLYNQEGRRELYRYMASFKSNGYSLQNRLLLHGQCRTLDLEPHVIGTFNEWKEKKTNIKPGEKALVIVIPTTKNYYYEYQEDGTPKALPSTHDKNELKRYENLIKENKGYKYVYHHFNILPRVFSISQTTIKESERPILLQRYNAENTSEENITYYNKLKDLFKTLKISFTEEDSKNESLGTLTSYTSGKNVIRVNPEMPTDAKIWTSLHELGHYILHLKNNNPKELKNLNHNSKEIQAELFANIVSEGLGINSEKAFSSEYISSYLKEEAKRFSFNLSEMESNHLMTHLKIIDPAVKMIGSVLLQENPISKNQIEEINNFIPDIFEVNNKNIAKNIKISVPEKTIEKGKR